MGEGMGQFSTSIPTNWLVVDLTRGGAFPTLRQTFFAGGKSVPARTRLGGMETTECGWRHFPAHFALLPFTRYSYFLLFFYLRICCALDLLSPIGQGMRTIKCYGGRIIAIIFFLVLLN